MTPSLFFKNYLGALHAHPVLPKCPRLGVLYNIDVSPINWLCWLEQEHRLRWFFSEIYMSWRHQLLSSFLHRCWQTLLLVQYMMLGWISEPSIPDDRCINPRTLSLNTACIPLYDLNKPLNPWCRNDTNTIKDHLMKSRKINERLNEQEGGTRIRINTYVKIYDCIFSLLAYSTACILKFGSHTFTKDQMTRPQSTPIPHICIGTQRHILSSTWTADTIPILSLSLAHSLSRLVLGHKSSHFRKTRHSCCKQTNDQASLESCQQQQRSIVLFLYSRQIRLEQHFQDSHEQQQYNDRSSTIIAD